MRRLLVAVVVCVMNCSMNDGANGASNNLQNGATCKNRKDLVGQCYKVRGRLRAYDTPPHCRIWPVGTSHLLGVVDAAALPSNVACGEGFEVYADFLVCPITPAKASGMQSVCVASAGNLRAAEIKREGGN